MAVRKKVASKRHHRARVIFHGLTAAQIFNLGRRVRSKYGRGRPAKAKAVRKKAKSHLKRVAPPNWALAQMARCAHGRRSRKPIVRGLCRKVSHQTKTGVWYVDTHKTKLARARRRAHSGPAILRGLPSAAKRRAKLLARISHLMRRAKGRR